MQFFKNSEAKLLETVKTLRGDAAGYYAMHFKLSRLEEQHRSEYQLKIALNILRDLFSTFEGGIFQCQDSDIVLLYKGQDKLLIEKAVFQLRYLFVDDPLAYDDSGEENDEFCTIYDLGFNWRDVHQLASDKLGLGIKEVVLSEREKNISAKVFKKEEKKESETLYDFTPTKLAALEQNIIRADLHPVIRHQPICAITPGKPVKPVFDEIYVHISELRQMLGINYDLVNNKGLFKYLTQILDRNVLSTLLAHQDQYLARSVSINLNIETLLSDQFSHFSRSLPHAIISTIIVEIQVSDVFMDMPAFFAARDIAHEQGLRICLDGLSSQSFVQIKRESLGVDLAKLQWNPTMQDSRNTEQNKRLADAVKQCGANRMILCRCDNQAAIQYGQSLGIVLYQGRYVDKMLDPNTKIVN